MRITQKALDAINKQSVRFLLAEELECSENTIRRYIADNEDNNDLTKVAALQIIQKETGMVNKEILEESVSANVA